MAWTDDKVAHLRKLWGDGFSASQCASRIGGVTRNAVIGKAIRLGLAARAPRGAASLRAQTGRVVMRSPTAQRKVRAPRALPDGRTPKLPAEPFRPALEPVIPAAERKSLECLAEMDCRWPLGDGPFTFCGRRRISGQPYCKDHMAIAYQGPVPRQRAGATPFVLKDMVPA